MTDWVLSLDKVSKRYGAFIAVDELSLRIPKGSIYGLLGPNGAGKTTTIRMILDIIKPASGQINILGHDSAALVRHRLGYLPEEKGLYKKMKAWSIISYFATLKGLDRRTARQRAYELLEQYGLGDFAEARIESLSKGMGQKVQVLAAVAHNPELVILDEPFSGLDPVNQESLEQLIRNIAGTGGTVIFSTHVMQHAERLCDRFLLVTGGRKVFDGTIEEACAMLPRRVLLESTQDLAPLCHIEGVLRIMRTERIDNEWEVHLQENANPQKILQECSQQGIALARFDYRQPGLHDVFVHLVNQESREQADR